MGRLRRFNRKDNNEENLVTALRQIGMDVIRLDKGGDLLVGWQGFNLIFEVKNPNRRIDQQRLTVDEALHDAYWPGQTDVAYSAFDIANRFHKLFMELKNGNLKPFSTKSRAYAGKDR